MQTKGSCLADFEDIELCESCGNPAALIAEGITLCRKCYRNMKKQKHQKEEEE
jgi:ribosomal protein S14